MAGGMPTYRQFMAKKKVTKNDECKAWLTFMDYFATEEGRTLEMNFCYADTKKQAKEKHLDRFVGEEKESRDYFGVWVEVYPIESKKAKELLVQLFQFGEHFHKNLVEAGIEFHLKCHCNYS